MILYISNSLSWENNKSKSNHPSKQGIFQDEPQIVMFYRKQDNFATTSYPAIKIMMQITK